MDIYIYIFVSFNTQNSYNVASLLLIRYYNQESVVWIWWSTYSVGKMLQLEKCNYAKVSMSGWMSRIALSHMPCQLAIIMAIGVTELDTVIYVRWPEFLNDAFKIIVTKLERMILNVSCSITNILSYFSDVHFQ